MTTRCRNIYFSNSVVIAEYFGIRSYLTRLSTYLYIIILEHTTSCLATQMTLLGNVAR